MTPTTNAGRALLADGLVDADTCEYLRIRVDAIEREAAAQERERIRETLNRHLVDGDTMVTLATIDTVLAEPTDATD